jgi:hypothetical protein
MGLLPSVKLSELLTESDMLLTLKPPQLCSVDAFNGSKGLRTRGIMGTKVTLKNSEPQVESVYCNRHLLDISFPGLTCGRYLNFCDVN